MLDPRCGRELLLRGGITTIMVTIAYFILNAQPWVWLIPLAIIALVCVKWALRPRDLDDEREEA
jgi:ABC-type dipeptide/oligopeptide/nickel transport system permease subunit